MRFRDRREAGRELARLLSEYAGRDDVTVLALPRGGVPVAFEVAAALRVPMDVFVVRKLGVPGREELAFGAIGTGGVRVLNEDITGPLGITPEQIDAVSARETEELRRRESSYRGDRPPPDVAGRTVLVIDDGLATGATMKAAVAALGRSDPAAVVVAVPVAASETLAEFGEIVDRVICARVPERFLAVGHWYEDFSATTDQEVRDLLARVPGPG